MGLAAERRTRPPSGAPRPRRRAVLVAGLCLVAVSGVAAFLLLSGDEGGGYRDGPLDTLEANRFGTHLAVGRPTAYGIPVVFNRGDRPITLRRAWPARATPGLGVRDVLVAGSRRRFELVSRDDPPRFRDLTDLHPLEGFKVAPMSSAAGKRGVELVFILSAARKGRYGFRGVQVDYSVGGEDYREVFPNSYVACVGDPPVERIPDCGRPERGIERP